MKVRLIVSTLLILLSLGFASKANAQWGHHRASVRIYTPIGTFGTGDRYYDPYYPGYYDPGYYPGYYDPYYYPYYGDRGYRHFRHEEHEEHEHHEGHEHHGGRR